MHINFEIRKAFAKHIILIVNLYGYKNCILHKNRQRLYGSYQNEDLEAGNKDKVDPMGVKLKVLDER